MKQLSSSVYILPANLFARQEGTERKRQACKSDEPICPLEAHVLDQPRVLLFKCLSWCRRAFDLFCSTRKTTGISVWWIWHTAKGVDGNLICLKCLSLSLASTANVSYDLGTSALKLQTGVSRHRICHFGSCCRHQDNNTKTQTAAQSPTVGTTTTTTTKRKTLSDAKWHASGLRMDERGSADRANQNPRSWRTPASREQINTAAEKLLFDLCAVVSLTIRDWQWGSASPAFVLPERTWAEQKKRRATKVEVWWTFTKTHTRARRQNCEFVF